MAERKPDRLAGPGGVPASTALACLVLIGRNHGLQLSAAQLASDAGLTSGEPDAPTLAACAERVGFRARAMTLDWRHLGELKRALPAIVSFKDGRRFVLSRLEDVGDVPQVVLLDPTDTDEPLVLLQAAFELAWSGEVLLLRRAMPAQGDDRPFGWPTLRAMAREQGTLLRDVVLSSALLALLALSPVLFAEALVGQVLNSQANATLLFLSCGILLLIVFEGAFATVRRGLVTRLSTRLAMRVDALAFERLLRLPISYFQATPIGSITARLGAVERIEAMLAGSLARGVLDLGIVIVFVPAMLATSLPLGGVVVALGAVAVALGWLLNGRYRRASAATRAVDVDADVLLARTLGAFPAIRSLALEPRQRRLWDVVNAKGARLRLAEADAAATFELVESILERLIVFGPFALGVWLAISGTGGLSRAALFGFLLMSWRVAAPLREITGLARDWNVGRAALAEIAGLIEAVPEVPRGRQGALVAIKGHIAFQGVQFTYPDGNAPAVDALTFEAPAGTMLGIMGRSGAGKSTVARLLQRLHVADQGLIKIDGIDIRDFDLDHLRASVAVVGDDVTLFPGTIRDNLLLARPDASPDALMEAIRLVGAETMVERLPRGLDTPLGEGGDGVSDGERQRLGIARAILMDAPVLVLDEATSSLDPESEAMLNGNLRRIGAGRTLVVISQRLAALVQADAIVVLDRGEVQDIGRHHDLIERSDLYSGLWRRQNARLDRPKPSDKRLGRDAHVA